jgi:hypothetical protein
VQAPEVLFHLQSCLIGAAGGHMGEQPAPRAGDHAAGCRSDREHQIVHEFGRDVERF